MVCIQCGQKTQVINSRPQLRSNQVWRRRQCLECGAVFTTGERADYSAAWTVKVKTGQLEPFSRDRLLLSLHRSLQHRPSALADAAALTETIIKRLQSSVKDGAIASRTIIQVCQVALNRFDKATSVHYQAFHRS